MSTTTTQQIVYSVPRLRHLLAPTGTTHPTEHVDLRHHGHDVRVVGQRSCARRSDRFDVPQAPAAFDRLLRP